MHAPARGVHAPEGGACPAAPAERGGAGARTCRAPAPRGATRRSRRGRRRATRRTGCRTPRVAGRRRPGGRTRCARTVLRSPPRPALDGPSSARRPRGPHRHARRVTTALQPAESASSASAALKPRLSAAACVTLQQVHLENCVQKGRASGCQAGCCRGASSRRGALCAGGQAASAHLVLSHVHRTASRTLHHHHRSSTWLLHTKALASLAAPWTRHSARRTRHGRRPRRAAPAHAERDLISLALEQ